MIEIVKYNSNLKKEWDDFVKKAKNSHFIFYRDYMEYHSDKFKDYSLLFYLKGKLIGLLPANKKEDVLISHEGLTFGGIISDKKMTTPIMLELFNELLNFLKKEKFKTFVYKSIPYIYHSLPAEEDKYALFVNDATLYKCEISSVISLESPIYFQNRRRRGIKKALKYGVNVHQSFDYKSYMDLVSYILLKKYHSKPVHSVKEIEYLAFHFPDNIKLFTASNDKKELLAGVIIYENKFTVKSQYIISSEKGQKQGALDLVFNFLITEKYKNKRYFDFGTSNLKNGKFLNKGVIEYKESFGGRGITYETYQLKIK